MSTPTASACPHCRTELKEDKQAFCTSCGMALYQPCPQCAQSIATPAQIFTSCQECSTSFWSCPECGRLYHLDRTSCQNTYCPEKGNFWTARFGSDTWDQARAKREIAYQRQSQGDPIPGWVSNSSGSERRQPILHHSGLLVSVLESGVVELWAEHGSPSLGEGMDEFREESVCLARLDLGEPATGAPILHEGQPVILGSKSLAKLEWSSNPSLAEKISLPNQSGPLQALSLGEVLLVAGVEGLWEVDPKSGTIIRATACQLSANADLRLDPKSRQVLAAGANNDFFLYSPGGELTKLPLPAELSEPPEWTLWAEQFVFVHRNKLAYLEENDFKIQELPAAVVSSPIYDGQEQRLLLLLSDNTARSCSPKGDRFSFLCDLAGSPTTSPLKVGTEIYYGIEGRYLCSNQEALLPRLNQAPWGDLSYANGRIFGNTRDGGLFCFLL